MITKDYKYNIDVNYNHPRYSCLTVWNNDFSDMYTNDFVLHANKVHSKYRKHIKHLCAGNEHIIDGELYRIENGKIKPVTGTKQLALVQRLKTKEKVLAVGMRAISIMIKDFTTSNGSMHRTGEKRNREVLKYLRRVDRGDYYYKTYVRPNKTLTYSWFVGEIDDYMATYGMTRNEVRELVEDYYLFIDKNYNIVYKTTTGYSNGDPKENNKILLDMFGERNGKPIFEVVEIDIPSIKELGVC